MLQSMYFESMICFLLFATDERVPKVRAVREVCFTLINMGLFQATIYWGGGCYPPPSENSLRLTRIQYKLAQL